MVTVACGASVTGCSTLEDEQGAANEQRNPTETADGKPVVGSWPMPGQDVARTGNAPDGTGPTSEPTEKWTDGGLEKMNETPVVAADTVYIGGDSLDAMDAGTGDGKWSFEDDNWPCFTPAIADGPVYFGAQDSNVYAVDAATGEQQWTFATEHWVSSSPAVVDGIVFIGSDDKNLYALE